MPWFKVDDSFYDHPKIFDAPDCAVALWVRAGSWSARNLTDGFVPARMATRLCDDPEAAVKELVARGLWSRTKGGYRFHDWSEYQPTREEATAARERKSSGGRIGNHRRWHAARGVRDPACPYCASDIRSDDRSQSDRSENLSDSKSDSLCDPDAIENNRDNPPPHGTAGQRAEEASSQASGYEVSDIRSDSDRFTDRFRDGEPNPPVPSRPVPSRPLSGVDVGKSSSRRNARDEDDDDPDLDFKIDQRITSILAEETGTPITADWAARIRQRILDDRKVDRPLKYVTEALRRDPHKFLPPAAPLPGLPTGFARSTTDERVEQAQVLKALFRDQANHTTIQGETSR